MVGSLGRGAAVKKWVMRRLLLSVSGGRAGATSLGANLSVRLRCAGLSFGSAFRFLGGGWGRIGFLHSCVRRFLGGGAFTTSGSPSGGGWYRGAGDSGGVCKVL